MEMKICTKCQVNKPVNLYHKRSGGYLRSRCIECSKEDRKNYESKNEDKIKDYNKKNYQNRKDYHSEYNKKYRESHKEYERERYKKWSKENREHINQKNRERRIENLKDPIWKLKENIRSLIKISIKGKGFSKNSKTAEILGCSFEEFKLYLESKFDKNMNWENHGFYWHIDHKIPISWAKTQVDIISLNHYSNLQPKCAIDNLSKGNRYSD